MKNLYLFLKLPILLCGLFGVQMVFAQDPEFTMDDFLMTGTAQRSGDQCFTLTEDSNWKGGAVWFRNKVDLNQDFSMEIEVFLGCDDAGADGMVFIFHPFLTTGYAGEGMGFGGLIPSFGVEMDTYENYHLFDPWYDHVAMVAHGSLSHRWSNRVPVPLVPQAANAEDCKNHKVNINWQSISKKISFYFDGSLRIEEHLDLVGEVFSGRPNVYWGFTSATGNKRNRHSVCIEKLVFKESFSLAQEDKTILFSGFPYIVQNLKFPAGKSDLPDRAKPELDELIQFFKKHDNYGITLDGFTDNKGSTQINESLSRKRAEAIAKYLKANGISEKRILFYGNGERDPLSSNDTEKGRKENRRVEIRMTLLRV